VTSLPYWWRQSSDSRSGRRDPALAMEQVDKGLAATGEPCGTAPRCGQVGGRPWLPPATGTVNTSGPSLYQTIGPEVSSPGVDVPDDGSASARRACRSARTFARAAPWFDRPAASDKCDVRTPPLVGAVGQSAWESLGWPFFMRTDAHQGATIVVGMSCTGLGSPPPQNGQPPMAASIILFRYPATLNIAHLTVVHVRTPTTRARQYVSTCHSM